MATPIAVTYVDPIPLPMGASSSMTMQRSDRPSTGARDVYIDADVEAGGSWKADCPLQLLTPSPCVRRPAAASSMRGIRWRSDLLALELSPHLGVPDCPIPL